MFYICSLMDWKDGNVLGFVRRVSRDLVVVDVMLKASERKLMTAVRIDLDNVTFSSKVALLYDSIVEVLRGLSLNRGYEICNDECFYSFLLEFLDDDDFSFRFTQFRKLRNSINYKGEVYSVHEVDFFVKEMIKFRRDILKKYF